MPPKINIKTSLSTIVQPSIQEKKIPPTWIHRKGASEITGPNLWLFPVDDGEDELVLSGEQNNSDGTTDIIIGRVDPSDSSSFSSISWTTVATNSDTDGEKISDHWHIYAHSYHWISFSIAGNNKCYLIQLNKNFVRQGLYTIYDDPAGTGAVTNDHFLVENTLSVDVGLFLHGTKSSDGKPYLYIVQCPVIAPESTTVTKVSASVPMSFVNGASTYLKSYTFGPSTHFVTLAPEYIDATVGGIIYMPYNPTWNTYGAFKKILTKTGYSRNFPVMVYYEKRNSEIITLRESSTTSAIVRCVSSDTFSTYSEESLASGDVHRPHITIFKNYLITCWDSPSSNAVYMSVDELH